MLLTDFAKHKIMNLIRYILDFNDTPTNTTDTGDKPTLFITYEGNKSKLIIEVHKKGWFEWYTDDDWETYNKEERQFIIDCTKPETDLLFEINKANRIIHSICENWKHRQHSDKKNTTVSNESDNSI